MIEIDSDVAYFVELHGDTSMPKKAVTMDLEAQIQSDILLPIPDPFAKSYSDKDLTEIQIQKRDEDWTIISEGWANLKDDLLNKR